MLELWIAIALLTAVVPVSRLKRRVSLGGGAIGGTMYWGRPLCLVPLVCGVTLLVHGLPAFEALNWLGAILVLTAPVFWNAAIHVELIRGVIGGKLRYGRLVTIWTFVGGAVLILL